VSFVQGWKMHRYGKRRVAFEKIEIKSRNR